MVKTGARTQNSTTYIRIFDVGFSAYNFPALWQVAKLSHLRLVVFWCTFKLLSGKKVCRNANLVVFSLFNAFRTKESELNPEKHRNQKLEF